MVSTRSKLNELSKEELKGELLSFDNLPEKINDLTKKWMILLQNLIVFFLSSKTCNSLLRKRIIRNDHPWIILNI